MKRLFVIVFCLLGLTSTHAQRLVHDKKHLAIINSNGAVRLSAELAYHSSLEQIRKNTDDINLNLTSVVLVQNMIHRSLTEVNEALKDAIQVKRLGYLIADIYKNSNEALELAQGNPALMLFAEDSARQLKVRGIKMVADVSGFILKNNEAILINYNVRDELINNIVKELQVMNAIIYTIKQNMYWAKQRGLIKSFNPWSQYMSDDAARLNEIMWRRKFLGQ
jgi:hypothetical protein